MLKEALRKLGPEFGFLVEETNEVEQNVLNRLDRSVKLDEVDTITFGLETDDGKIVKVYVKVDQADDFEKALADKLGQIDDIEEVLNELAKEYEIVDVEWPSEDPSGDDEDEDDGSDVLNKKVYDNAKEQAETEKKLKPNMESLTVGERLTIDINESANSGTIESRFTTASQLMVYHALLELGMPELALSRSAYRAAIIKRIKEKALELASNPTMKNALKMFINRSIDYDKKAEDHLKASHPGDKKKKTDETVIISKDLEALTEGVAQDFWSTFINLISYIAKSPEQAKQFMETPALKQLLSRSSGALSSNVSSQMKTKLNDFKNAMANDGNTAKAKASVGGVGVAESYLNANQKLNEASPAEIADLIKTMLLIADSSKTGTAAAAVMSSSAWNAFFNAAKPTLSQKFAGQVRTKLNSLKQTLPGAGITTTESKSLKNAELAHAYAYGAEKFEAGKPIEVIGEDGDYYIVKPFPIMANGHMKLKKSAVKLTGKINVPIGGPGGEMPGGLNESVAVGTKKNITESEVPEWSYDMDGENVIISCATIKVILNDEEVEKLIKGITNRDAVIVRDEEDPTHKVAFSPRGSSVMVKKVGTPEGVMMKLKDVEDLLDFISKGEDKTDTEDDTAKVDDKATVDAEVDTSPTATPEKKTP